mgnify:CR=1 FL=1
MAYRLDNNYNSKSIANEIHNRQKKINAMLESLSIALYKQKLRGLQWNNNLYSSHSKYMFKVFNAIRNLHK